jgi:hypothetical protein
MAAGDTAMDGETLGLDSEPAVTGDLWRLETLLWLKNLRRTKTLWGTETLWRTETVLWLKTLRRMETLRLLVGPWLSQLET